MLSPVRNVRRLDVAMHHPRGVDAVDARRDLLGKSHRVANAEAVRPCHRLEVSAGHVGGRDISDVALDDDVGVQNINQEPTAEVLQTLSFVPRLGLARLLGMQQLEGDHALEGLVEGLVDVPVTSKLLAELVAVVDRGALWVDRDRGHDDRLRSAMSVLGISVNPAAGQPRLYGALVSGTVAAPVLDHEFELRATDTDASEQAVDLARLLCEVAGVDVPGRRRPHRRGQSGGTTKQGAVLCAHAEGAILFVLREHLEKPIGTGDPQSFAKLAGERRMLWWPKQRRCQPASTTQ